MTPDGDHRVPRRLADLDPRHRRMVVLKSSLTVVGAWVVLLTVYYFEPAIHHGGFGVVWRLAAGLALVAAVIAWQTRRIVSSELPELRAAEALGVVIPLFFLLFSTLYLSMSHGSAQTFSESLDHTRALYFTITVFSTVGFGDITPRTDTARILVSIQMLLDLAIIGLVVRLLLNAMKSGLERAPEQRADEP